MKIGVYVFAFAFILVAASLVAAEANNSTDVDKPLNISERCQDINNRIDGRVRMFDDGRDKHFNDFIHLEDQINKSMDRLDARGFNTSKIRDDVSVFDSKVQKMHNDYALFIGKLNDTKNFTCGHSDGEFMAALNVSKAQLKVVRDDVEDIKNFYKNTVKKDILDLRRENAPGMMNGVARGRGNFSGNFTGNFTGRGNGSGMRNGMRRGAGNFTGRGNGSGRGNGQ